jgi:deoxyribonuclease I
MRTLSLALLIACPPAPAPQETDVVEDSDPQIDTGGPGPEDAACVEAGFWEATQAPDDALFGALHDATAEADCSYDRARREIFQVLDDDGDGVRCVYTDRWFPVDSYPPNDWQDVNTEHSWPQSLGADVDPRQCDIHHLFPSDAYVNGLRGNLPFDEVTSVDRDSDGDGSWNGSRLGDSASGELVFEPRDAHKGNVARAMLYFWVRYEDELTSSAVADFARDRLNTFQSWDALDPVDDRELARTAGIADYQGHPNPFVVCPGLVDRFVESQ